LDSGHQNDEFGTLPIMKWLESTQYSELYTPAHNKVHVNGTSVHMLISPKSLSHHAGNQYQLLDHKILKLSFNLVHLCGNPSLLGIDIFSPVPFVAH